MSYSEHSFLEGVEVLLLSRGYSEHILSPTEKAYSNKILVICFSCFTEMLKSTTHCVPTADMIDKPCFIKLSNHKMKSIFISLSI